MDENMGLINKEPLTERLLAKFAELEPLFSMSTGAAMELFGFNDHRKIKRWEQDQRERIKREKKRINKAFENLMRADLVTGVKGKEGKYQLTPKGWITYARYYAAYLHETTKGGKGKGYLIIFDIPEKYRHFRDTLRRVLYSLGLSQLQLSVFLTHDPKAFEFVGRIVANCDLGDRVKFVVAEKVF